LTRINHKQSSSVYDHKVLFSFQWRQHRYRVANRYSFTGAILLPKY